MSYVIYKNRVHKYATVHQEVCGYVNMHGGVSRTSPPTGTYEVGFRQQRDAEREAEDIVRWKGWELKLCRCL